jgi:pyruvoyl-dependent arginine decarboxylase (PvlArgDC)
MANFLKLGDRVRWVSQSQGYRKAKEGEIVEVVPAGFSPNRDAFPQLYQGMGVGFPRNHDSYVVLVGKKPYWPRASLLEKVATS